MWKDTNEMSCMEGALLNFKKQKYLIKDLFNEGYNDTLKNKDKMDNIFLK